MVLGLLLGSEAPVTTPNSVDFSFLFFYKWCLMQAAARSPREPENVDLSAAKPKPPAAAAAGTATSKAGTVASSPRAGPGVASPTQVPKSTAGARAPPSTASANGGD